MTFRSKFTNLIAAPLAILAMSASAEQIDPSTPEGYIAVQRKIQCSLKDNEPVVYSWQGRAYSRVPGERDKNVFNLDGMNIRQCVTVTDPVRGVGYRLVSREIMLYTDPKTGELMDVFDNPWTGEKNEVIHVANDPVNFGGGSFGKDSNGKPIPFKLREINGTWMQANEFPLFYTNPLAGDYQEYVGGTYHATEIFDFSGEVDELLDANTDKAYPTIAWVRIADWLPFMEMGSRTGDLYFNAIGKKLENFDQLTPLMKKTIAERYPEYTAPPPGDDTRPNETSWTYMKKIIDKRNEGKPKKQGH